MVIGDIMLDLYLKGKVERISPEAPVPIVSVKERFSRLGGAANVAQNIKSLGAEPVLCAVCGNDIDSGICTFLSGFGLSVGQDSSEQCYCRRSLIIVGEPLGLDAGYFAGIAYAVHLRGPGIL